MWCLGIFEYEVQEEITKSKKKWKRRLAFREAGFFLIFLAQKANSQRNLNFEVKSRVRRIA